MFSAWRLIRNLKDLLLHALHCKTCADVAYITFSRNKPPQLPVKSITFPRAWYSGGERGMLYSYTSVLSRSQLVTLHVSAMLD